MGKKVNLNCNGCTECCRGGVDLVEGDDPTMFATRDVAGIKHTAVTADGMCIYVCEAGCSLYHTKRPRRCEEADCRTWPGTEVEQHMTDKMKEMARTVTERE